MNYNDLISKAIQNDEIEELLCGKGPYGVEISKFISDTFPTDINAVLVNCFYKQSDNIEKIGELFESTLKHMLMGNACSVYIAILYFDTCIFQEESKKGTFFVNRKVLARQIKEAVEKNKDELCKCVIFENGMRKNNPLKNISNLSIYYEKKHNFTIL